MVRGIVAISILVGRREATAGSDDLSLSIVPSPTIKILTPPAPISMMLVIAGIK